MCERAWRRVMLVRDVFEKNSRSITRLSWVAYLHSYGGEAEESVRNIHWCEYIASSVFQPKICIRSVQNLTQNINIVPDQGRSVTSI